ncbi:MlaC/ttg2D family ABC transporter substrate-binding protein [Marinomonas epiphytica]
MLKFIKGLVLLAVLSIHSVWANPEGARDAVIDVIESFRTQIVADKDILSKDPVLLNQRVDGILSDVVDFDVLSRRVMGKYYRRASKEQRTRFSQETKRALLNTYGKSILEFDADKIKVLPLGPQRKGKSVKVDVEAELEAAGKLNITFEMKERGANWILDNVVINGINFGLTFRKQFATMMQQNKNKIDDAIDAWRDSLTK